MCMGIIERIRIEVMEFTETYMWTDDKLYEGINAPHFTAGNTMGTLLSGPQGGRGYQDSVDTNVIHLHLHLASISISEVC